MRTLLNGLSAWFRRWLTLPELGEMTYAEVPPGTKFFHFNYGWLDKPADGSHPTYFEPDPCDYRCHKAWRTVVIKPDALVLTYQTPPAENQAN